MELNESPSEKPAEESWEADDEEWDVLTWEDSYAIARALRESHPDSNLADISMKTIYRWTIALPGFRDDPDLANEAILAAIYQEWYEEENPL